MEIILSIVILLCFAFIFKAVWELDKHYKWFSELKPGDIIIVEIFSNECECQGKAKVLKEPYGKYVEAEMFPETKKMCEHCEKANNSCSCESYMFHRSSVNKLPDETN